MPNRGDRGESLIEILAALTIMSIAITALMTALATHASTTVTNRDQSQASTTLLAAAEHAKSLPYEACGPVAEKDISAEVPHGSGMQVLYGPGRALDATTPCSSLTVVPVRVTGAGFDIRTEVVKRP